MSAKEESFPIPGYDGYQITKSGHVYSTKSRYQTRPEHELKGWRDKKGYVHVGLVKDGKIKSFPVHKLQELTFMGGPQEGLQIDHIDGNKENNNLSNLRQVTPAENAHNPVTAARFHAVLRSPEHRAKLKRAIAERFKDPEYREKVKNAAQIRLNDPNWQRNHAAAMQEVWSRPKQRKLIYDNLDKMNNDPVIRARNVARSKEVNSRPCRAVDASGHEILFGSVTECAQHFGVVPGTITRYMRDNVVTSGGWRFNRPDKEKL